MLGLELRRWRKTAAMEAASRAGENANFLWGYALRALRVIVLLSLWRLILEGHEGATPMSLSVVLTYTLISAVFADQLSVSTGLADAFWDGTIVTRFFEPMGIVAQFTARMLGRWGLDLALFSAPLLLVAPWLGVDPWPADAAAAGLFAVSLVLAISVGLALEFLFMGITLALEQPVWLIVDVRRAITGVLSGALLPLAMLPWGLGSVLEWLPFASMAWAPLAIYTGVSDAGPLLLGQGVWSLVLWPIGLWVWNASRERVVGYGG